jgi:TonB family protein
VLFISGDSDTRVAPLHARKMTALMQAATAGSDRPILLHYDTTAGHSGGTPVTKQIENTTNELSYLFWQLGVSEPGKAVAEKYMQRTETWAAQGNGPRRDSIEVLSDTLGVDFGPYMKRLRSVVRSRWEPLIPNTAMPPQMKKGVVVIEFAITKDGKVTAMKLAQGSGDIALDRAAWGAILDANPLPNLPAEFSGNFLRLRTRFYYNPDKNDQILAN